MIAFGAFGIGDGGKCNTYNLTLPYTRIQLVSVKYITGLCIWSIPFILSLILNITEIMLFPDYNAVQYFFAISVETAFILIPISAMNFVTFKFGYKITRILKAVLLLLTITLRFLTIILKKVLTIEPTDIIISITVILASFAVYGVSWLLSIRVYEKKYD